MFFCTLFPVLLLGASAYAQLEVPEPSAGQAPGTSITVTELDTSEPMLWQMAAFAARQMSTKQRRFKLATLTAAEQIDSLYRLKVTLQRVNEGYSLDKNDVLYCTVEVKSNAQGQQWVVENFGCTLPAMVRRRRPQKKMQEQLAVEPIVADKFAAPISNDISDNKIDSDVVKAPVKRQARPFFPQAIYQPTYRIMPAYPVYYQAYY